MGLGCSNHAPHPPQCPLDLPGFPLKTYCAFREFSEGATSAAPMSCKGFCSKAVTPAPELCPLCPMLLLAGSSLSPLPAEKARACPPCVVVLCSSLPPVCSHCSNPVMFGDLESLTRWYPQASLRRVMPEVRVAGAGGPRPGQRGPWAHSPQEVGLALVPPLWNGLLALMGSHSPSCESLTLQKAGVENLAVILSISVSSLLSLSSRSQPAEVAAPALQRRRAEPSWAVHECASENVLICLKQAPLMLFK